MRVIAFVLASLACWGNGSREQKNIRGIQRSSSAERNTAGYQTENDSMSQSIAESEQLQSNHGAAPNPSKVLAKLFLTFSPSAGWQVGHAGHPSNLIMKSRIGNQVASRSFGSLDRASRMTQMYAAPTMPALVPLTSAGRTLRNILASGAAVLDMQAPKTNAFSRVLCGTFFSVIATFTVLTLYPLVLSAWFIGAFFDKTRRRASDFTVSLWARMTMTLFGAGVRVEGAEHLPPPEEAVMYCPNHCSFLDIFSLSGYVPRRFKYISKIEILRIPLIGWAMGFAKHIAIRRTDRASQLKTLKDAVSMLKAGNSLVTFPEGTRSKDGRLGDFKKGPFTMAGRAGVRVVPITIVGTHLFQPPGAFVPFAIPRGIRIIVHPALGPPQPKKEDEVLKAAKAAVESALPESMKPLTTAKA